MPRRRTVLKRCERRLLAERDLSKMVMYNLFRPISLASRHFEEPCLESKPGVVDSYKTRKNYSLVGSQRQNISGLSANPATASILALRSATRAQKKF